MDLARATKFGTIGGIGTVLLLVGTAGLSWVTWSNRTSGYEGRAMSTIMLVVIAGTTVTIIFLFVVIGEFIDRELEARGLDKSEE